MKHKRNIFLPALSVLVFVAFSSRADQPTFHPEEGLTLKKRVENTSEISLDDMTMVMNGQEMDASMLGMEMTTNTDQVVAVTDVYVAMGEGAPSKLSRTFDELSSKTEVAMSNQMTGDMDQDMHGSSDLEGLTVVFSWDEDEGDYSVAFAEGSDGDEELLDGLREALDLRGMLPSGEVSKGDTWDVVPDTLLEVFAPCGSVKIQPEELGEMMGMNAPQPSPDQMLGDFEGEVTAEFDGVREEDGVRVGIINLKIDVSTAKDLTEFMEEMLSKAEMPEGMDIEMDVESMDMEFSFEGEGQLLWNLEAGVLYSLEISGEVSQTMDSAMNLSLAGTEQSMEQSMSFSGTQTIKVSTTD